MNDFNSKWLGLCGTNDISKLGLSFFLASIYVWLSGNGDYIFFLKISCYSSDLLFVI